MQSTEPEIWKTVVGYEGLYDVSDRGQIRSYHGSNPRLLHPYSHPDGHLQIALWRDGTSRRHWVHRLVLEAFVGPASPKDVGRHLNDVPNDNRVVNLAWGTVADNHADARRNGRNARLNRERCIHGHLLREPNLRRSANGRQCLACGLARGRVGGFDQTISDDLYSKIMGGTWDSNPTHCKFGHLLGGANVVRSDRLRGRRRCLACQRARSRAKSAGIPFTKRLADGYFYAITTGEISPDVPPSRKVRDAESGRFITAGRRIYPENES